MSIEWPKETRKDRTPTRDDYPELFEDLELPAEAGLPEPEEEEEEERPEEWDAEERLRRLLNPSTKKLRSEADCWRAVEIYKELRGLSEPELLRLRLVCYDSSSAIFRIENPRDYFERQNSYVMFLRLPAGESMKKLPVMSARSFYYQDPVSRVLPWPEAFPGCRPFTWEKKAYGL